MNPMPTNHIIEILATVRSTLIRYRRAIGYALLGLLVVLVIAIATAAFIARETMPTSKLYSLKVKIYEPVVMMTKFSASAKAEYATNLIESRFQELMYLRDTGATDVAIVSPLVARATETIGITAQHLSESDLRSEERIDALLTLSIPVKAMETIAQATDSLDPSEDAFEELRKTISKTMTTSVQSYASTTDAERAKIFLGTHIERVTELLPKVAPGSTAQRIALTRIEDMRIALEEGDIGSALVAILRAEEILIVDGMVWGSERGDGPDIAPIASTTEGQ